jgi:hypothetical protein
MYIHLDTYAHTHTVVVIALIGPAYSCTYITASLLPSSLLLLLVVPER